MAWFNTQNGLDMQHVAYKGLVQGLQDIMTSRLDVMFTRDRRRGAASEGRQAEGARGVGR
jgi:hypothetical protein